MKHGKRKHDVGATIIVEVTGKPEECTHTHVECKGSGDHRIATRIAGNIEELGIREVKSGPEADQEAVNADVQRQVGFRGDRVRQCQ